MNARTAMLRVLPLLALPPALAGCGDETGPGGAVTYTLEAVNDEPLPMIIYTEETPQGTTEVRLVSGRVTLDDERYDGELVADLLLDGEAVVTGYRFPDAGSYALSGSTVTLTSSEARYDAPITGTLVDGVLTLVYEDPEYGTFTARYRR